MSESIIFTGGGSGGHTMPALSLIKKLEQEDRYKIYYIGAKTGIEREIMASMPGVTYFAVPAGK
ncbi:MAG TPA: glycosyltransferase, partial [Spirochaetota bacterium]|nr:glycosyltransferase [Spirochaetota bacterium]